MVCFQYEVDCLGTEGISYKKYFMDRVRMRGEDYENKKRCRRIDDDLFNH